MDTSAVVSLQDVANIVTFIAPGYFAMQVYSLTYAKKDRDFSRLLIESVIYSLPIVTLVNIFWEKILQQHSVTSLNITYALVILCIAILSGALVTFLRMKWPIIAIATRMGLGSPDEDFVKTQLLRINAKDAKKNPVTVKLRSGTVFSGTADRLSRYDRDGLKYYYFANLAWFNKADASWDEREGGIIVERSEIEYIETPKLSA
jgi:hypothetical protein